MPTNINLRMPHPSDDYVLPLDVSMGELRALDKALTSYKEQREAFRQEVSDAVDKLLSWPSIRSQGIIVDNLARFIIAKPDHVQDALEEVFAGDSLHIDCAKELRAALAARGLTITETKEKN